MNTATTLEQFEARALNNTLELCYIIDNWVAAMHKKTPLMVELCEAGRNALTRTLITVRNDIRHRRLADLTTKPGQSYYIALDHHMISIGVETFIDPYDPNAIDDNKEYFHILGRYMFPILSVNDWAKENGVEPNTVRQWINRERINVVKRDNGIGISLLQYKPGAISQSIIKTARYKDIHQVPDDIAAAFPFLREKDVTEIHILPDGRDHCRVIMFINHADDNGSKNIPQDVVLTKDEAEKLIKMMDNASFINKRERNYIAPFPEAEWTLNHRLPTLNDISGAQQSMRDYPPIGYIGKLAPSDFNPVWEVGAKKGENTIVSVKGQLIRAANPANNLLTAIFAAPNNMPMEAINAIRKDSGWQIDNGWADDTLYINEMTFRGANQIDDVILFLKTLPYRMYNICRHQFCRVVFHLNLTESDEIIKNILSLAGYRQVDGTNTFYAYVIW